MINSRELLDFVVELIEGYKLEVDPENYLRKNVTARGLSGTDFLVDKYPIHRFFFYKI